MLALRNERLWPTHEPVVEPRIRRYAACVGLS